jgi:TetR/AcrR family transcriptional repressor of nem operon
MRYDPEHRQRTREKVVRAAAVAIRKHGPDRIGVAGLMAKAGLTHGGFYAHFRSKDELVAEAISYMFDDRYAVFRKGMEDVEPAQGLAAYIDRYLTVRHRDQPEKGCPLPSLSGDLARMPTAARKRFEDGTRRLTDSIADALRAMKRPHPDALAASVLAEMVGAMAIARAVSNDERSEQILEATRDSIKARIGLVA